MNAFQKFVFDGLSIGYAIALEDGTVVARAFTQEGLRRIGQRGIPGTSDIPVGGKLSIWSLRPWRKPILAGEATKHKGPR